MKAVNEGRLTVTPAVQGHWDLCLQCRACEVACPSGVPYGRLMEATRASMQGVAKHSFKEKVGRSAGYNWVLAKPGRLRMAGRALKLYQRTPARVIARGSGLLKILPGRLDYLDKSLPRMSKRFFVADGRVSPAQGRKRARVAMLAGCVMTLMHAPALEAATRVLARNGVEVVLTRGQGCCGALNSHAGERATAREMARHNIDSFLATEPDAVIVASAGCGSTMKEYTELLHSDPQYAAKAERVSRLTKDIHEFLAALPLIPPRLSDREPASPVHPERVEGRTGPATVAKLRVVYQDACHLANAQRVREAPRKLLRAIPGIELVEIDEPTVCCGSAGTYSITQREMSERLGKRKAVNISAVHPDVVATGNPGCALQVDNYLRSLAKSNPSVSAPRVRYVVELLDDAYRAEVEPRPVVPSTSQGEG